jgi:microcystin-dependent protein
MSAHRESGRRGFLSRAIALVAGAATLGLTSRRAAAAPQSAAPYIGEIMLFGGFSHVPAGWLPCNGQLLPIAQYENLFFLLGTAYGGDGQNTFALPDFRGSMPIHQGTGSGLTSRAVGDRAGAEAVTLDVSHLPVHAHVPVGASTPGTSPDPGGLLPARNAAGALHYGTSSDAAFSPQAVAPQGGGQAHPNLPPFLTVSYYIAYEGTWPSPS